MIAPRATAKLTAAATAAGSVRALKEAKTKTTKTT